MFSYGSGCGAEFFAARVAAGAGAFARHLDLAAPLANRRRLTVEEYEVLRRADADADRRPVERERLSEICESDEHRILSAARLEDHAIYLGVDDSERRVYRSIERVAQRRVA